MPLEKEEMSLHDCGFYDNSKVFVATGPLNDKARIQHVAQLATNIITVHITLPVITKEILDAAGIPSESDGWSGCRLDDDLLAGSASDQSASEDSSLTDSER